MTEVEGDLNAALKGRSSTDLSAEGAEEHSQEPVPHEHGEKVAVHVQDRGDFLWD